MTKFPKGDKAHILVGQFKGETGTVRRVDSKGIVVEIMDRRSTIGLYYGFKEVHKVLP